MRLSITVVKKYTMFSLGNNTMFFCYCTVIIFSFIKNTFQLCCVQVVILFNICALAFITLLVPDSMHCTLYFISKIGIIPYTERKKKVAKFTSCCKIMIMLDHFMHQSV